MANSRQESGVPAGVRKVRDDGGSLLFQRLMMGGNKVGLLMGWITVALMAVGLVGCRTSPKGDVIEQLQEEDPVLTRVAEFWEEFRRVVGSGNDEEIANHVSIAVEPMDGIYPSREELLADFDWLFPEGARKAIADSGFGELEFHKNDQGVHWKFFWTNGLDSEGQYSVSYWVGIVNEEPKIILILAVG